MIAWLRAQGWLTGAVILCAVIGSLLEWFWPLPDGGAAYWLFGLFGVALTMITIFVTRNWWLILCLPFILWPMAVALFIELYLLLGGDMGPIGF